MPLPDESATPAPGKGPSGLAVASLGCGTVVVVGLILAFVLYRHFVFKARESAEEFAKNPAKATAVLMVGADPAFDLVKTNDAAGEITIREKATGRETTLSFDAAAKGDFQLRKSAPGQEAAGGQEIKRAMKEPAGESVSPLDGGPPLPPSWVPAYPGWQLQDGGISQEKKTTESGTVIAQTGDATVKVKEFYESRLKAEGYETEVSIAVAEGGDSAVIAAKKDNGARTITVLINADKDSTNLVITYEGPK